MARHLGHVTTEEAATLYATLGRWLDETQIAGAISGEYSLYTALEDEVEKARDAIHRAHTRNEGMESNDEEN